MCNEETPTVDLLKKITYTIAINNRAYDDSN